MPGRPFTGESIPPEGHIMRLVITGGAGFLGYHLCNRFSDRYDEISILDIAPVDPKEYPTNVRYFNADVRKPGQLSGVFRRGDRVIHAAAALPLWKKKDIYDINVDGTENVLREAERNGIERVVYISSTAVYGIPRKHPIHEDDPLDGVGHYGRSKIEAERICGDYQKKGMCVTVLRPKTFIGPGRSGVFHILHDWIEDGKRIPIIGSGKNRYQLLAVEDLSGAIHICLNAPPEKARGVFNVGAEEFGTVLEDVSALCAYAGTGACVLSVPARPAKSLLALLGGLRLSPVYRWIYGTADTDSYVSIEKIKNRLNWSPEYSNSEALIRSYAWYREHRDKGAKPGLSHRAAWEQRALKLFKRFF